MKMCPCRDCDDRSVGCHCGCNGYKDWRAELDKVNAVKFHENELRTAHIERSIALKNIYRKNHRLP